MTATAVMLLPNTRLYEDSNLQPQTQARKSNMTKLLPSIFGSPWVIHYTPCLTSHKHKPQLPTSLPTRQGTTPLTFLVAQGQTKPTSMKKKPMVISSSPEQDVYQCPQGSKDISVEPFSWKSFHVPSSPDHTNMSNTTWQNVTRSTGLFMFACYPILHSILTWSNLTLCQPPESTLYWVRNWQKSNKAKEYKLLSLSTHLAFLFLSTKLTFLSHLLAATSHPPMQHLLGFTLAGCLSSAFPPLPNKNDNCPNPTTPLPELSALTTNPLLSPAELPDSKLSHINLNSFPSLKLHLTSHSTSTTLKLTSIIGESPLHSLVDNSPHWLFSVPSTADLYLTLLGQTSTTPSHLRLKLILFFPLFGLQIPVTRWHFQTHHRPSSVWTTSFSYAQPCIIQLLMDYKS